MVHEDQGKMVQEVAAELEGGLPERYVLREEKRPNYTTVAQPPSCKKLATTIPIVDVSRLGEAEEAGKLQSALESWGLFVATGHGMPKDFLDEILDATRSFFHSPLQEKQKCSNVIPVGDDDNDDDAKLKFQNEGYGVDRIDSDEQVLDWCDRLWLQLQPEDERRLQFWPQPLRELLHEYTLESGRVTMEVLKAMARLVGQKEDFFIEMVGERFKSYARFTYYPPCPRPDLVNGLKPHTDNSVVTLLLMDKDVAGLQVLKDGRWLDVPVLGHDLLVVVGEGMEIVSNAVFKAPWHRVATNAEKERMSLAVFYQPEPERIIGPPGELVHEERPPLFKRCLVHTLADGYWDAFAVGDRTVDFLNVRINDHEAAVAEN